MQIFQSLIVICVIDFFSMGISLFLGEFSPLGVQLLTAVGKFPTARNSESPRSHERVALHPVQSLLVIDGNSLWGAARHPYRHRRLTRLGKLPVIISRSQAAGDFESRDLAVGV